MTRPKIFFLHVGKTGGTAIDTFAASHFEPSDVAIHIENDPLWFADHQEIYRQKTFLSGHVSFAQFLRSYPWREYYRIAMFRQPSAHIAAHLTWVRHLSEPGQEAFLGGHPEWVQAISFRLQKIDFSQAHEISAFVNDLSADEVALFDNCQTRYLVNVPGTRKIDEDDVEEALDNLCLLDRICLTEFYRECLAEFCLDMGWQQPEPSTRRLNVARPKYGLDAGCPDTMAALQPLIWADRRIYAAAEKAVGETLGDSRVS